jgi:hypothetical protein
MIDKTSTRRQTRRRQALNLAAQALGYPSWGKLETALLRGEIAIKIDHQELEKRQKEDDHET